MRTRVDEDSGQEKERISRIPRDARQKIKKKRRAFREAETLEFDARRRSPMGRRKAPWFMSDSFKLPFFAAAETWWESSSAANEIASKKTQAETIAKWEYEIIRVKIERPFKNL